MSDTDDDTGTWFAEIVTLAALAAFVGLAVYGLWWWTRP